MLSSVIIFKKFIYLDDLPKSYVISRGFLGESFVNLLYDAWWRNHSYSTDFLASIGNRFLTIIPTKQNNPNIWSQLHVWWPGDLRHKVINIMVLLWLTVQQFWAHCKGWLKCTDYLINNKTMITLKMPFYIKPGYLWKIYITYR